MANARTIERIIRVNCARCPESFEFKAQVHLDETPVLVDAQLPCRFCGQANKVRIPTSALPSGVIVYRGTGQSGQPESGIPEDFWDQVFDASVPGED